MEENFGLQNEAKGTVRLYKFVVRDIEFKIPVPYHITKHLLNPRDVLIEELNFVQQQLFTMPLEDQKKLNVEEGGMVSLPPLKPEEKGLQNLG